MDEAQWLASTDPALMLAWRHGSNPLQGISLAAPLSDRKLRLFACACVRQVWDRLTDPRSRRAVEVAERFADGQTTLDELADAWDGADSADIRAPGGFYQSCLL